MNQAIDLLESASRDLDASLRKLDEVYDLLSDNPDFDGLWLHLARNEVCNALSYIYEVAREAAN